MEYQDPLISCYQIDEFTDFMILKNFSPRTIKTYYQQVLNLYAGIMPCPPPLPIKSITRVKTPGNRIKIFVFCRIFARMKQKS